MLDAAHFSQALTYFLAMLLSLTVHEAAHALVAKWRGDDTAQREGRLTLNPFVHADPFGTYLMPLIGALTQMPVIGWAKPVPVDLRNVKNPRWDNVFISAAGPVANLVMCVGFCAFLLAVQVYGLIGKDSIFAPFLDLAEALIWVNAFLAFFNLIPLPPLDGSAVLSAFLPRRVAAAYEHYVAPYGFFLLLAIAVSGGLWWLPKLSSGFVSIVVEQLGRLVAA